MNLNSRRMKRKNPLILISMLAFTTGCFLSSCKNNKSYNDASKAADVNIDGVLQKTTYYNYESKWNLEGIQIRFDYEDGTTKLVDLLDMQNVSYECYPSSPRASSIGEVALELKNVTFNYPNGQTKDLGFRVFMVSVNKMEDKKLSRLTTINQVALILIFTLVMTLTILFKKEKIE